MKTLYPILLLTIALLLVRCKQDKTAEISAGGNNNKTITFADFKKIKGVENVQEVPYQLFSKLDSVQFFIAPDKSAAHMKVAFNKLHNYYGFEEFDDFYAIHYSIENNISNSIEAYVLKSEFTASFDLTLKGVDLYEIRSSNYKDSDDTKNKSFAKYGTITEVSEQEFTNASTKRVDEILVKNPLVKLNDNNWIYTGSNPEEVITQYQNVSTEDGLLNNDYMGRSAYLDLEVFKEHNTEINDTYYTFYDVKSKSSFELFTAGFPQILPSKSRVSAINTNYDVGSDFLVSKYMPHSKNQVNLLYVNFTQFKVGNEMKAFWADNDTFYAEVYPVNSAVVNGKKQKAAFIKIQLKSNLF